MKGALGIAGLLLAILPTRGLSDPPKPIVTAAPQYPKWAIGSGLSTEVELRMRIGRDGKVGEVEVVPYNVTHDLMTREMRASFDSAAVHAVRAWRFRPATRAGRPMSVWWTLRVPLSDPLDGAEAAADSVTWLGDTAKVMPFPEPIERQAPEWPAAVPFICRGRVTVRIFPGPDGRVWGAHVARFALGCQDPGMRAVIDLAVVQAALRWRYRPGDHEGEPILVDFAIPRPRLDVPVIVGCVRDSLSGKVRVEAEIFGRDDRHPYGQTDDTGWFVLRGAVTRAGSLRAHYGPCRAGGYRTVQLWKRPGDELTLYTGPNRCASDPR